MTPLFCFHCQLFVGNLKFDRGFVRVIGEDSESTTTRSSAADESQSANKAEASDDHMTLAVAIAVPCFALVLALLVTLFICSRRRRRQAAEKSASLAETGSSDSQQTISNSCFGKLLSGSRWSRFSGSPRRDSFESETSHKLPPLPANAIFGHDRRTTGVYRTAS